MIKDLVDKAPGIAPDPQLFEPTHRASAAAAVAIRTSPTVDAALPAVRTTLQDIWGDLAPRQFSLMIDAWHDVLMPYRGQALLLTLIAVFCLPLAAVGLTGALLYFVRARTRETAIRIALGADPVVIRRGVVLRALATVGTGIALGLMLGIAAGRIIAAQLFEVHQADPLTIASVIAALLLVAWLAALAPAHQASRVDPAAALRQG